jgi:hypothetical protein
LLFHILIGLAIVTGLISILTFILYALARMREELQMERRFQSIHYISLLIFVAIGVIILIMLSNMDLG